MLFHIFPLTIIDLAHFPRFGRSQHTAVPGAPKLTQSYTYDFLNRLKSAEETDGTTQS